MKIGKLNYWSADLVLQPVTCGAYMLAPGRYAGEHRSKRFVTPTLITDLVPVWRNL